MGQAAEADPAVEAEAAQAGLVEAEAVLADQGEAEAVPEGQAEAQAAPVVPEEEARQDQEAEVPAVSAAQEPYPAAMLQAPRPLFGEPGRETAPAGGCRRQTEVIPRASGLRSTAPPICSMTADIWWKAGLT